jgi:solute:Na+ symporter, SSS family
MTGLDWIVVALYFALVAAAAVLPGLKARRAGRDATEYFLASRHTGWLVVGASLFASNIGSEHLVGLAGTGAASGVAVGQFEVLASLILLLLGWVFVPFYLRSGVFTMPEFLERRYSEGARWYLAIVSIIAYVLTKISVTIAAGGVVFETLMGVDFWTGAIVVVIATGLYTVIGGLRAVLYTDLLQTFVLIGGSVVVTLTGLRALGGWDAMVASAGPGFLDMWKPITDPSFPWTGIAFGAPILGIWYWCTDQFIVQRTLAAEDATEARRGTIFAGFLKLLPVFLFVVPGMIAAQLAQQGRLQLDRPDQALPALVAALLPAGFRGVVVAGLLAALMSSLSGVFNSCSTLITWDVYRKLHPRASERQLVWVGQLSTTVLVVLGLLWIPLMKLISAQLYQYIQSVQAYIAPPVAAAFLLGILWRRANARGAMTALIVGFVLGMGRLLVELNKGSLTGILRAYAEINFLHFAAILFLVCVVILIVASLTAPPPKAEQIEGITFGGSRPSGRSEGDPAKRRTDLALSGVLVLGVLATWLYFSE